MHSRIGCNKLACQVGRENSIIIMKMRVQNIFTSSTWQSFCQKDLPLPSIELKSSHPIVIADAQQFAVIVQQERTLMEVVHSLLQIQSTIDGGATSMKVLSTECVILLSPSLLTCCSPSIFPPQS